MAFTEDPSEFLDTTHGFAVVATWKGTTSVNGIFDDDYFEDGVGQGPGAESSQPRFLCRSSDVPAVAQNDTLAIGAVNYVVTSVHPDGTGMTLLILEKQ